MIACSSSGMMSKVTLSVTRRPPKLLLRDSMRKTGSTTAKPPHDCMAEADQAAAPEQRHQHQQRSENHLPMLGEAREPLLEQQIRGGADDGAVERAEAAKDQHHDQLAGALPGHIGRAHELGGVGEQETGKAAERAGNHVDDELK